MRAAGKSGTQALPSIPSELLSTFRVYQRSGSYSGTATALGLSVPQVKRRLAELYALLGIEATPNAGKAIQASYLLRDLPY